MFPEENILFRGIDFDDCRRMITCFNAERRFFKSGSIASVITETSDKIGIILKGSAIMVKYDMNGNRTIMEKLGEQGVFGEFFSFPGASRICSEILCESDCDIMFFRYAEITKRCEKACKCHSIVVENLLSLISEKAAALSERIEILSQRTISEKLISCLQIIEDRTPVGKEPELPFSITELSDYLCVNRSALQKEISKLRKNGTLILEKRKFRILA